MKKIFKNQYIRYSLFIIVGLFAGWLIFHSSGSKTTTETTQAETHKHEIWTCAMHPQIRMDKPGLCPICAMELIPLTQGGGVADSTSIHLSAEAMALANVLTSVVTKQKPVKEIRLYGKVLADESLIQSLVSHLSGRIEKLFVNFTGEEVYKGQKLASIYSPELITAQQELLETIKLKATQPAYYAAAKEKLSLLKLTDAQIAAIEKLGKVQNYFDIISDTKGIVTSKRVNSGDYVTQGTVLYDIADLSKVWLMFDAYESDLLFISKGDEITFSLKALPGKTHKGSITFIDPVIDPVTRVAQVRVEVSNTAGKLKPEMFATGIIAANLTEYTNSIIIPRSSVLWTGKRSLVYVKKLVNDESVFTIREVDLGPMLSNSYVVTSGLAEGEEIVTQGTFSVDAAAQLEGKPSMMNSESRDQANSAAESARLAGAVKDSIKVSGNCSMCKKRIEDAAKTVKGVMLAKWDENTKMLVYSYTGTVSKKTVSNAVVAVGHDTELGKAIDKVYNALPACCKYR